MNKHVALKSFVSIEGRALVAALKPLRFVVEHRNTIPILGMVRLTLSAGKLTIAGTDLDIEIIAAVELDDYGDGAFDFCLDPRTLLAIARSAGTARVRIEPTSEGAAIIVGETEARYTLHVLGADAFPTFQCDDGPEIERFGNGSLATLLRKVATCISTEETRYYLNGVFWESGDKGRFFTATDGHRLHSCCYSTEPSSAGGRIIPRKTVALLLTHFATADIAVRHAGAARIRLDAGAFTIKSKLIDGTFPNYRSVIPSEFVHRLEFAQPAIADAVRRVSLLASTKVRAVRFYGVAGRVTLSMKNHDVGEAVCETATAWPDDMAEFGVNARYLSDMIAGCEGRCEMLVKDSGAPIRVLDEDDTMTRVLMPMRV